MQNHITLDSNATNQILCEETPDQNQSSLNSNANHPNQFLCEELEDLKTIIQRIQNLPNTASGIEIKKQVEFQMKDENSSWIPNKVRGKRPTNVLGKNKLNVKRRKDDNDIIENALKESTPI
ncbi:unnamed protein product [Rhizophagus irregularis]|nr:unnamed protein product [Rhizophagus irregularis]